MNACDHTIYMLQWWSQAGITQADLAIRRSNDVMIWHHQIPLSNLPLSWARAENARQADIYIRPARGISWPLLFLDDVALEMAQRIANKYAALLIHTSPAGGYHVWLRLTRNLCENQRYCAQQWLIPRIGADPGSVSGEHLGRLAGTKNWKRNGTWVNTYKTNYTDKPLWDPLPVIQRNDSKPSNSFEGQHKRQLKPISSNTGGYDSSESGKEWGWVCGALARGLSHDLILNKLIQRSSGRRGRDVERYAHYTLQRAIKRCR